MAVDPLAMLMTAPTPECAKTSYVSMDEVRCHTSFCNELVDLFWELLDYTRNKHWKKKLLTAFMVSSSIVVFTDLLFLGNIVRWIHQYAEWMSLHIFFGTFFFIILLALCTLVMIPPAILTFACGFVFSDIFGLPMGVTAATLASFQGCAIGATIAFWRARYMMRDLVTLFAKRYKIVRAADRAIARHGFRVMVLLRLCPIIPFNALNYVGGITAVTFEEFVLSLVGILPLTVLTVLAGATASSIASANRGDDYSLRITYLVLMGVGFVFVVVAVLITIYFARKELRKELEEEKILEEATKDFTLKRRPSHTGASTRSMNIEGREPLSAEEAIVDDEEWFWIFP
jgi:uncharacterized membrane protein YdjX (TVP38/TMEM64 family)